MALPMDIPMPTTLMIAALDNSDVLALALFHRAQALSATSVSNLGTHLSSILDIVTALHTALANLRTEAANERSRLYSPTTAGQVTSILNACASALGYLNRALERPGASSDAAQDFSAYVSQIRKHQVILQHILEDVQKNRVSPKLSSPSDTDDLLPKDGPSRHNTDEATLRDIRLQLGRIAPGFVEQRNSSLESTDDDLWLKVRAQLVKCGLPSRVVDNNSSSLKSLFHSIQRTYQNINDSLPSSTTTSSNSNATLLSSTSSQKPLTATSRARSASISYSSSPFQKEPLPISSSSTTAGSPLTTQPPSTTMRTRERASSLRDSGSGISTADFQYIITDDLTRFINRSTPLPIPTSKADSSSKDHRGSHTGKSQLVPIGPDQFGNLIAPSALWTKVDRTKFTAEAFRRSNKHFEAFPDFIAVLGFISESDLVRLANLSKDIRQERLQYAIPSLRPTDKGGNEFSEKGHPRKPDQYNHYRSRDHKRDYGSPEDDARRWRKEHENKSQRDQDTHHHKDNQGLDSLKQSRTRASSMSLVMPGPQSHESISRPKPCIVSPPISTSENPSHNMALTLANGPMSRSPPTRPKSILKNANPHDVVYDPNPREVQSLPRQSYMHHMETAYRNSKNSIGDYSDGGSHTSSGSERERHRSRRYDYERDSSSDTSHERYISGSSRPKDDSLATKPRRESYAMVSSAGDDTNIPPSARKSSATPRRYSESRRSSTSHREDRDSFSSEQRRDSRAGDNYERHCDRDGRKDSRDYRHAERDGRDHRKERRASLMSALRDALY